jgi:fused signal recognition particle receptor
VISQRYGADPSAVSRDALEYASKHYIDVVLIDTAGRMQTAKNLMDEIGKIVKVIKPDIKLFVGDSLSGNDTINQAREFFSYTEFDGAILTKTDADAKGGSAISISYITSKPIIYLGVGQGYDDIIKFNRERFIETIFNNESLLDSHQTTQTSLSSENYMVPDIEEANVVKNTVNPTKDDVTGELNRVIDPDFDSEDSPNSKALLAKKSTEVLSGISEESMNDEAKIDSTSSFNTTVEQQESYSIENSKRGIEEISKTREEHEEEKKEQGEKKSRFGWFKKKK